MTASSPMVDAPAAFVPLATGPFERFQCGSKTVEVRQLGGRWTAFNFPTGRRVRLRRGYSTPDEILGTIGRVATAPSYYELPLWALHGADIDDVPQAKKNGYFDPDAAVLAFEVLH